VTEVADAATLPQLTGQVDLTRQRYTANGAVPPPLAGSIRESGTAQLAMPAGSSTFSARTARRWTPHWAAPTPPKPTRRPPACCWPAMSPAPGFQLVRLNEQANVARRTLAQREETLKLVRDRVNAGLDTRLELRQSEGGLPEARLQLETLLKSRWP
jgi:outer membrane protein TolC